jgi:hypothetical protein
MSKQRIEETAGKAEISFCSLLPRATVPKIIEKLEEAVD